MVGQGAGGERSALRSVRTLAAAQALQGASSEEAWARLGSTLPSPLVTGQAKGAGLPAGPVSQEPCGLPGSGLHREGPREKARSWLVGRSATEHPPPQGGAPPL